MFVCPQCLSCLLAFERTVSCLVCLLVLNGVLLVLLLKIVGVHVEAKIIVLASTTLHGKYFHSKKKGSSPA